MAKTKISEFSSTPANNTDINGINIAEGCAPSGINNAIRQLMADLKDFQAGTAGDPLTVGGALTVTGTTALSGAATAPTPATSDSSTNIATTAYVTNKIAASTSGLSDPGGSGIVARTATAGATVARTITAGTGISVSNGSGVSGNPTITNSGVTSFNGSTGAVTGVSSVNGQTGAVTTGMVLLGSLSTTSGTTQTLSGLDLTNYKQLVVYFKAISFSVTAELQINGVKVTTADTSGTYQYGQANVELATGLVTAISNVSSSATSGSSTAGVVYANTSTLANSSTSVVFAASSGNFDNGSINVYGIK